MRPNTKNLLNKQSISSTYTSSEISTAFVVAVSAQLTTTSTLAGALTIEASNDVTDPTAWNTISSGGTFTTAGTILIPKLEICYNFIRFKITYTSGSGVATLNFNTLGF
jgi:hypothetical protein